jgi:hypothetical protein
MTGITHHTPAVAVGRIPKLSYNEDHDVDDASIAVAKLSDHNKANHDSLDIDADTLDGHDSAYFAVSGSVDAQTLDTLDSADFEQVTNKNVAEGYCPLDSSGLVPTANLPSIDAATLQGESVAEIQAGVEVGGGESAVYGEITQLLLGIDTPQGWHICDGTNGTPTIDTTSQGTITIMYVGGEFESMTARDITIVDETSAVITTECKDLSGNIITKIEDGTPFKMFLTNTDTEDPKAVLVELFRDSDDVEIMNLYDITVSASGTAEFTLVQYIDCTWHIYLD